MGVSVGRTFALGTVTVASLLILAACTGPDGKSADGATQAATPPAVTSIADETEGGTPEAELAPLEATPQGPDDGPGAGRGFVAGLDTSFRSVDLSDIHFDLFNGSTVPLSAARADVILALRDLIPPLDASRALLPLEIQERVGEVAYIRHENATFLQPLNIVLGYVADDGQAYAYSLGILDAHEIVNETLGGSDHILPPLRQRRGL